MNSFSKYPDEKFTIDVDFSLSLQSADILSISAAADSNEIDKTLFVISSATYTSKTAYITVYGGQSNELYRLKIIIDSTDGSKYQMNIFMNIY